MAGCTVLVTADRRSGDLAVALERRGATVRHAPACSIVPHADDDALLAATRALVAAPPDILVATTGVGFRAWIEAADAHGLHADVLTALAGTRILARGPKARGAIQAAGLTAAWVAESETSAEIAELLLGEGVAGRRVAVQQHGAGADGLDDALVAAGADVTNLVTYRWGPPADPAALQASVWAVAEGEVDAVVFTSAPGAEAWLRAVEDEGLLAAVVERCASGRLLVGAVGPVTAAPLERRGIAPVQPDRARLGALVRAVVAYYEQTVPVATVAGPLVVRARTAVLGGRVLPLASTGVEILRLLASAPGAVLSRDQVLDALPGGSRDPHAVEVAVARTREAAGRKDLIRTVVKRGYTLALA